MPKLLHLILGSIGDYKLTSSVTDMLTDFGWPILQKRHQESTLTMYMFYNFICMYHY